MLNPTSVVYTVATTPVAMIEAYTGMGVTASKAVAGEYMAIPMYRI